MAGVGGGPSSSLGLGHSTRGAERDQVKIEVDLEAKADWQCMQEPVTEEMDGKDRCWQKLDVMLQVD